MDIRKTVLAALTVVALMGAPTMALASPHHSGGDRGGPRVARHEGGRYEGRYRGDRDSRYYGRGDRDGRYYGRRDRDDYYYGRGRYGGRDSYYYRGGRRYHHYWNPYQLIWVDVIEVEGNCP